MCNVLADTYALQLCKKNFGKQDSLNQPFNEGYKYKLKYTHLDFRFWTAILISKSA